MLNHVTNMVYVYINIYRSFFEFNYIYIYIYICVCVCVCVCVGSKDLRTLTHLISSPRPTPRSKKCSRTNGENPGLQIIRLKTVISSAGHNHGREKRYVTQGGPPEDREGDSRPYGLAIKGIVERQPQEEPSSPY